MDKTVLTFYCDDTNPYVAPPEAFKIFLDFVSSEGIAGEASLILGFDWENNGLISQPSTPAQATFLELSRGAYACGIDTQFELMTHGYWYNFERGRVQEEAGHEGVWLFEPGVSVETYETYFQNIINEGEHAGICFTGLTQPGCGCERCKHRHAELDTGDQSEPNPNVWQALLKLAQKGKFRGHTVPCFFGGAIEEGTPRLAASSISCGVYNLPPNMWDRLGSWLNTREWADADYYITEDGRSGRIVDFVRAQAPYAMFYCHWQGLNPLNGFGWEAFSQVVRRVHKHLQQEVTWMRPSQYTEQLFLSRSSVL